MFLGLNDKGYCFGYTEAEVKNCFRQNRYRSVRPIHCIGPSDAMDLISTFCLSRPELKKPSLIRLGKFTRWKQWRKVMILENVAGADDQSLLIKFTFHERNGNSVQFTDGSKILYRNSYENMDANIELFQKLGYVLLYSYPKGWIIKVYPDDMKEYKPIDDLQAAYVKLARIVDLAVDEEEIV